MRQNYAWYRRRRLPAPRSNPFFSARVRGYYYVIIIFFFSVGSFYKFFFSFSSSEGYELH